MPNTIKVQLVAPAQWERLQKEGKACGCVTESLGFADPTRQRAYVRNTAWPELNKYLIQHEFEHLLEEEGTDECQHGYRHKKFFRDILTPILKIAGVAAAPFTGGASLLAAPVLDVGYSAARGERALGQTALKSYGVNVLGAGGGSALGEAAAGALGQAAGSTGAQIGSGLGGALGAGGTTLLTGGTPQQALGNAAIGGAGGFGGAGGLAGLFGGGRQVATPAAGATGTTPVGMPTAGMPTGMPTGAFSLGGIPSSIGGSRLGIPQLSAAPTAQAGLGLQAFPGLGGTNVVGGGISGTALSPLQRFQSGLSAFGTGLSNFGRNIFGGGQPGGGGGGGGGPTPISRDEAAALAAVGRGGQVTQPAGNMAIPQGAGGFYTPQTQGAGRGIGNFLPGVLGGMIGPALLGAGIAGAGQAVGNAQTPQIPQLSQLPAVQQLTQQTQSRLAPLAQQFAALGGQFGGLANAPLPEALASPINRFYTAQERALHSQFAGIQPGVDLGTTSGPGSYNEQLRDLGQRRLEALGQRQFEFQANQRQNLESQRQAMISQLGVTKDELGQLQQLAQLDIDTIMARTGLRAEQASQLKQIFGTIGATVAGAGILSNFRP